MDKLTDLVVILFLLAVLAVLTLFGGVFGFVAGVVLIIVCSIVTKRTYCEVCGEKTKGGHLCGDCITSMNQK